eukprot:SAG11_NODE_31404_length_292_cov_0.766839_1_plen_37_part_01
MIAQHNSTAQMSSSRALYTPRVARQNLVPDESPILGI